MRYRYYSNGLSIGSDFYLPELAETALPSQVHFRSGKVRSGGTSSVIPGFLTAISAEEHLLDIPDVASFLICGDNEVVVDPYPAASETDIRLYLLSSVVGILLHKNRILALHASSVVIDNAAVLFSGRSGIGKSTIALGLYRMGCPTLNDDITSVFFDEHRNAMVYPGYKHLKLWKETMTSYGLHAESFRRLRDERDKFSFPLDTTIEKRCVPLKAAIFLHTTDGTEIIKKVLNGIEAFEFLRANTFRHRYIRQLNNDELHFEQCATVARQVPVIKVMRPLSMSPQEFAENIKLLVSDL